jgi:aspartyl-tRNA(Asn)/glutamyl-tRNA(Gln) amidotransferase subunit C
MDLTPEEIQHITQLTRIKVKKDELEEYRTQLSIILEYFEILQEVDTDGVPHTGSITDKNNVMRDDKPETSLPSEQALANAPNREDDYFRVHAVLD